MYKLILLTLTSLECSMRIVTSVSRSLVSHLWSPHRKVVDTIPDPNSNLCSKSTSVYTCVYDWRKNKQVCTAIRRHLAHLFPKDLTHLVIFVIFIPGKRSGKSPVTLLYTKDPSVTSSPFESRNSLMSWLGNSMDILGDWYAENSAESTAITESSLASICEIDFLWSTVIWNIIIIQVHGYETQVANYGLILSACYYWNPRALGWLMPSNLLMSSLDSVIFCWNWLKMKRSSMLKIELPSTLATLLFSC